MGENLEGAVGLIIDEWCACSRVTTTVVNVYMLTSFPPWIRAWMETLKRIRCLHYNSQGKCNLHLSPCAHTIVSGLTFQTLPYMDGRLKRVNESLISSP